MPNFLLTPIVMKFSLPPVPLVMPSFINRNRHHSHTPAALLTTSAESDITCMGFICSPHSCHPQALCWPLSTCHAPTLHSSASNNNVATISWFSSKIKFKTLRMSYKTKQGVLQSLRTFFSLHSLWILRPALLQTMTQLYILTPHWWIDLSNTVSSTDSLPGF